ncbi:DNA polymerase II [Candidatus Woesearchaeota archaeon]|nr:DNA polymerase II [Candidatus Woesearchaeota archaeon]
MKGFIIYPTYRIINDQAYVYLFGRLENGKSFLTINYYKPYFYIKELDLNTALKLEKFDYEKTNLKDFNGNKVIKIILNIPSKVPELRELFKEVGIECYEADIRFPQRFLIDHNVKGSLDIEGSFEVEDTIDRLYKEPILKPAEFKPELKVLSLDIETSSDGKKLYSIALHSKNYNKILLITKNLYKDILTFKDEPSLLNAFIQEIKLFDPDIITGWNVIGFDLKYLNEKFKKHKIEFLISKDLSKPKFKFSNNFFRSSKVDVVGRQVLDALDLMKTSFIKVEDYKLSTVASKVLGKSKLIEEFNKHLEIDRLFKENPEKLAEYNLNDAILVYQIIEKTGILELTIKRSLLTGIELNKVSASIASLDSLYLREANQKGLVCPSSKFTDRTERITGGYVMESLPGIYNFILNLDFKSLYPTIMMTFNIDPASFVEEPKTKKDLVESPNKAYFKNQEGILPIILKRIFKEREIATKNKDELTRYALKTLMNSMFGVLASPNCRFYNLKIANAITHFGQFIIKLTAKKIEEKDLKVICSDTDSIFTISSKKSLEEAEKQGEELKDYINNFFRDFIKKEYNRDSHLEFEYEKCFIKFFLPKLRHGEGGAKKRYAGLVKEKIEFTGVEAIRGDWTPLAKKFQEELLWLVFHNENPDKFILEFVDNLKKGKFDDLLIYKKSIRKELEEYTKITPAHVKAARKLKQLDSNKIEYVLTEEGPEPIQNLKHKIDYQHYINKQIKPIADSVLTFFNKNFEEILKGSKQVFLSDF